MPFNQSSVEINIFQCTEHLIRRYWAEPCRAVVNWSYLGGIVLQENITEINDIKARYAMHKRSKRKHFEYRYNDRETMCSLTIEVQACGSILFLERFFPVCYSPRAVIRLRLFEQKSLAYSRTDLSC